MLKHNSTHSTFTFKYLQNKSNQGKLGHYGISNKWHHDEHGYLDTDEYNLFNAYIPKTVYPSRFHSIQQELGKEHTMGPITPVIYYCDCVS